MADHQKLLEAALNLQGSANISWLSITSGCASQNCILELTICPESVPRTCEIVVKADSATPYALTV